jgi:hypothetical protein
VAVEPDLDRVREIRAHLHKRRPEHLIDHIEVVRGDSAVGLVVAEPGTPAAVGVGMIGGAGEHPLELLGHPDRGHPAPPLAGQPVQVRAHHLQLPLALGEADHRDVVGCGVLGDLLAEPQPDLLQDRRGRDRKSQVVSQEVDHLTGHLQVVHPPVEVDPIQALQIQTHVPIQDVVHGHHAGRHRVPPGSGVSATPLAWPHPTATSPANPTTTSAVRGEASLVAPSRRRSGVPGPP